MEEKLTPAMKQYYDMKAAHPERILFFRMGDFYEMFNEDAEIASRELGLTLTSRNKNSEKPTPLAGIPYHAADKYLAQLTRKGYSVAISEQTSDAKLPGLVQRAVVRVVTPGTTLQDEVLDAKTNNYILALTLDAQSGLTYMALSDLSTGSLILTSRYMGEELKSYLYITSPAEILLPREEEQNEELIKLIRNARVGAMCFRTIPKKIEQTIEEFYKENALSHIPLEHTVSTSQKAPLALLLTYLEETQKQHLTHIQPPKIIGEAGYMRLDENAVRNLEILGTLKDGKKEGSLLGLLDLTRTGPGARLLRYWLVTPLTEEQKIQERLQVVTYIVGKPQLREQIRTSLGACYDLERILSRLSMGRGNARDLLALQVSLHNALSLHTVLAEETTNALQKIQETFREIFEENTSGTISIREIMNKIATIIVEEPPMTILEGGIIKDGVDAEIDELRHIRTNSQEWLLSYQEQEQRAHSIPTLKVKFNNVFGYFIEISNTHSHKAPEHYVRKQTTVNGERYTTSELKVYEEKILTAEDRLKQKEGALFEELRKEILSLLPKLLSLAEILALLDVLSTFAEVSYKYKYAAPTFNHEGKTEILEGRHPVVEERLKAEHESYTPNNTQLDKSQASLLLLTGPNMAGKSTYMRQVAHITLLAQIGCFVPAKKADLSIKDALFTRVGASDNVSAGQSTFMVEMQEVASIIHHATEHSLIILDEVGRGTSTYDGLSLAWAIMEYIHTTVKATTIFATHYHELIEIVEQLPGATNRSMAVAENSTGVTFLHQIVSGGASKSYGIEVGHLAGLPTSILDQARSHLVFLEEGKNAQGKKQKGKPQPSLFGYAEEGSSNTVDVGRDPHPATSIVSAGRDPHPPETIYIEKDHKIIDELKNLSINEMSPMQALLWIEEKKKEIS